MHVLELHFNSLEKIKLITIRGLPMVFIPSRQPHYCPVHGSEANE